MPEVSLEACQIIGRQQFDLENMRAEYMKLIGVLGALKAGDIVLDQVVVNVAPPGFWQVIEKLTPAGEAAKAKPNGNRLSKAR